MNRKLLVVGVFALAAMVALSGCVGGGGDSGEADAIEFVPNENVDGVFHVDMAILEDQTTQDLTNTLIEMQMESNPDYDGPESYDEVWEEFNAEAESDFDPRDLNEVVVFTSVPENPETAQGDDIGAAVLSADLTEDEMVSLIEENATVESGEYNGVPFYTVEPEDEMGTTQYMAVLQEGVFSFGQEGPVQSTVDVAQGDADALSGELREELDRVRDGYINFAVSIPEEAFNNTIGGGPTTPGGQGEQFGAFREITVVSGSYYTEGDTMGLSANMRTGGAEDAQDISDAIDGLVALGGMSMGENASAFLDPVETETDETTVIVTYETTVDELAENIENLQQMEMGSSTGTGGTSEGFGGSGGFEGGTGGVQPPQSDGRGGGTPGGGFGDGSGGGPPEGDFGG